MITTWLPKKLRQLFQRKRRAVKVGADAARLKYYRERFKHEAAVGGRLFGPIPDGTVREFFCLDARTWIWHEQWTDENGTRQRVTTRYDVRPDGIYKYQNSAEAQLLTRHEADNFHASAVEYCHRMQAERSQAAQQYHTA